MYKRQIKKLKDKDKIYLSLYKNKGYELGFGKAGFYKGHSHKYFYDLLYSPEKIILKDRNLSENNYLLVVPPKTFMSDIEIGNFFFLKFCPSNDFFSPPEKTQEVLTEGELDLYSSPIKLRFTWYKTSKNKSSLSIDAQIEQVIISFGDVKKIKIIP